MIPFKLLLAKTSNKLSSILKKKSWSNSTLHGVDIAKLWLLTTKKLLEDFQITLTSFWLKSIQHKTKFQALTFKDSQLSNSTKKINQLSPLNTEELEMLMALSNGLRKTLNTNGLKPQLKVTILEPNKDNCDNQYSYFEIINLAVHYYIIQKWTWEGTNYSNG